MSKLGWPLLCLIGAAVGCGGSGGGGSTVPPPASTAFPKLTIEWGTRSKATNVGSSALSVRATLRNAGENNEDFVWVINRDDQTAGFRRTYTSAVAARTIPSSLKLEVFTLRNAAGSSIGEGTASTKLDSDGEFKDAENRPLPAIAITGKVASVYIQPNQSLREVTSKTVTASALTANGEIVPVSEGSITFSQSTGQDKYSITPLGLGTGTNPGFATITASCDGFTSPPETISILPWDAKYMRSIGASSSYITASKDRKTVYYTRQFSNVISKLDADTAITSDIETLPFSPGPIASSGNFLIVGARQPFRVSKFDLATKTIQYDFTPIAGADGVHQIAISPVNNNLVAVAPRRNGNPSNFTLQLYRSGVFVGSGVPGNWTDFKFSDDGTHLFAFDGESFPISIVKFQVTATGLLEVKRSRVSDFNRKRPFTLHNGEIRFLTGEIYRQDTLAYLRAVPVATSSQQTVLFDDEFSRYLSFNLSSQLDLMRQSDNVNTSAITIPDNNYSHGIALGRGRYVITNGGTLKFIWKMPEFLPR
jgi:hypothetical protein